MCDMPLVCACSVQKRSTRIFSEWRESGKASAMTTKRETGGLAGTALWCSRERDTARLSANPTPLAVRQGAD